MATINYQVKENNNLGTHSFFCVAKTFSTLTFEDLADEVVESVGLSPAVVRTVLERYMVVAQRNVLRGHRVKMGDLLTIYPQISCTVKDELNDDGTVKKAATADMLNVSSAKSTIGATISQAVQQQFSQSVSWKRVTEKADEETDTTPTTDPTTDPDNPSTDPDNTQGGGTEGGGSGDGNE